MLEKAKSEIITYRNYKSINVNTFNNGLDKGLKNISNKYITYDLSTGNVQTTRLS